MDDFLKQIHDTVLDAGAKDLARKMGEGHVSLLQRVNPNNDAHRTTVQQYYQILLHSGDFRSLKALCADFGFDLTPRKAAEPTQLMGAMLDMSAEVADVTRATADALRDGNISQTERAMIRREIEGARKSLDVLEASIKVA